MPGRAQTRSGKAIHVRRILLLLLTIQTTCVRSPLGKSRDRCDSGHFEDSLANRAELTDGLAYSAGYSTNSFADSSSLSSCELG